MICMLVTRIVNKLRKINEIVIIIIIIIVFISYNLRIIIIVSYVSNYHLISFRKIQFDIIPFYGHETDLRIGDSRSTRV